MQKITPSRILVAAVLSSIVLISGCGGGGGSTNSNPDVHQFSGTVAIGAALQNVAVSATCAGTEISATTNTNSVGNYSISVFGNLPCKFKVIEPISGMELRSLSDSDGTVNITPLSEAIYILANGDTAKLVDAKSRLSQILAAIGSPSAGDPITAPFSANEIGIDKNILDFNAYLSSTSRNDTPLTGPNALSLLPAAMQSIDDNCSTQQARCVQNETLLSKITSIESREIGRGIFVELDKQLFLGGVNAYFEGSWDEATRGIFERGYKYAIAILIEKIGPQMMKASGISKSFATELAKSFSEDALKSAGGLRTMTTGSALEYFVNTGVGVVVEKLEEATLPALQLDGSFSDGFSASLWGFSGFTLEVASKSAITCAFHQWACEGNFLGVQFIVLKSEVESLISWISKDAFVLAEISKLSSDIEMANRRIASMESLLAQYSELNDTSQSVAFQWATTANMRVSLADELKIVIAESKGNIQNLLDSEIDAPTRVQLTASQERRLDRLVTKWSKIEGACRNLKSLEGQLGISKCLNLMNIKPAAPLYCATGYSLNNGACIGSGNTIVVPASSFARGGSVALSTIGYGADTLMNGPPYREAENWAEWDIEIPSSGPYELFATYASGESRPVNIFFNGVEYLHGALSLATGGYYPENRATDSQGVVQLNAGKVVMRVAEDGANVFPHIQGFKLVRR